MFPYLDLAGFGRRTSMPGSEVTYIETDSPGFTASRIAVQSSWINGRLRKRYGNTGKNNSLPLGQNAPTLLAAGTAPPSASLSGRPTVGSVAIVVTVPVGGALGVAQMKVSIDGGISFGPTTVTAASQGVPGTGLTLTFAPLGPFSTDNVYSAATPVPEIVLGWLTTLVTFDLYARRGINPSDPTFAQLQTDVERVTLEVKEAADSKDGLFDLPVSEDLDSAVTTGGPLGFSDASPYAWQDRQARHGRAQDAHGRRGGGWCP